jgi:beta-galactosidase
MVTQSDIDSLRTFVDGGGTLVVGFWSGLVDVHGRVRTGPYPAALRDLLGLVVADYAPLAEGASATIRLVGGGDTWRVTQWTELVTPEADTEVLASYVDGDLDGMPAVTRHRYGRGSAYYVSAPLPPAAIAAILERALADAGVEPSVPGLPPGVEAVRRGPALFLFNHGDAAVDCRAHGTEVHLGPRAAIVLRPDRAP